MSIKWPSFNSQDESVSVKSGASWVGPDAGFCRFAKEPFKTFLHLSLEAFNAVKNEPEKSQPFLMDLLVPCTFSSTYKS